MPKKNKDKIKINKKWHRVWVLHAKKYSYRLNNFTISVCAKKLRKALLSVYSVFLDNPLSYTVIIVQTL